MSGSNDDKFNRIEGKIDSISERLNSIDVTLVAQHESLKYHIRRTDLLEKAVEPINKHVNMVAGAMKLLAVILAVMGAVEGIVVLLEFLKK